MVEIARTVKKGTVYSVPEKSKPLEKVAGLSPFIPATV